MLEIADEDVDFSGTSTICTGTTDTDTTDSNAIGTDTMRTNAVDADSTCIDEIGTGTTGTKATIILCSTPFFHESR